MLAHPETLVLRRAKVRVLRTSNRASGWSRTRSPRSGRRPDVGGAMPRPWESLAMFRALGAKERIAYSLRLLGHAVRLQSDLERAPGLYRESLALFGETGDK